MRANNNLGQTHRPVTEKLHLRYDSDTSLRLTAAAHRQTTAYNRTVRDLWDHPGTPLQTSAAEGNVGLYTHLLAWREDTPELQLETTPSALARGGIAQARAAMAAFDESLERDTDRIRGCRHGSRKYRRLLGQENKIRGRAIRLRDHAQTELANSIAEVHDIVAIEDLQLANMTKSAEGTSESPGANTAAKRGLNRGFAGVAPGRQAAENKAACIRRGSVYQYVHPGGTSITCSECGKNAKESRLSQSEFCCVGCNYTANADANAAENIRMRGLARVRASARRRIEKRKKKRAESTVRSTEPRPGNGGAAGGNSAAAPYANGTGRCRESRCRGPS